VEPIFLTVEQTARALQISTRSVSELVASGALKHYRLGRGPRASIRVSPEQIAGFLAASTYGADE
jgi:excisionase family DNA binding protein